MTREVAKFRVPLTPERAGKLLRIVEEYPEHTITIETPFLVVSSDREPVVPACHCDCHDEGQR